MNQPTWTVAEWNALSKDEQADALALRDEGRTKFNEQSRDGIDWARWSWNPVTGCLGTSEGTCSYCYARDMANRFFGARKFEPRFHPHRLKAPANTRMPETDDVANRCVFVCSMADLFGSWVPGAWIEAVLAEIKVRPLWDFLLLTKNPWRLIEFRYPPNAWIGVTVNLQERVAAAEDVFAGRFPLNVKWISVEPMIEPIRFWRMDKTIDWLVLGGAGRSARTPEWRPPREWVVSLVEQARMAGVAVYEKTNLWRPIREYPGAFEATPEKAPAEFFAKGETR